MALAKDLFASSKHLYKSLERFKGEESLLGAEWQSLPQQTCNTAIPIKKRSLWGPSKLYSAEAALLSVHGELFKPRNKWWDVFIFHVLC